MPAGRDIPVSGLQRQVWLAEQVDPEERLYNEMLALRLDGPCDPGRLERALRRVTARHPAFRTRVTEEGGRLRGELVADAVPSLEILPPAADPAPVLTAFAERRYRLDHAPLVRYGLLPLPGPAAILLIGLHHLAADGRSLGILLADLRAELSRPAAAGPAETAGYGDFARWLDERAEWGADAAAEDYWRASLDGVPPVVKLSPGRGYPAGHPAARSVGENLRLPLSPAARAALGRIAGDCRVSPFAVLFAVAAAVASATAGQADLVLGTGADTRTRRFRETCGHFVNLLPIRMRTGAELTLADLAQQARDQILDAMEHRHVPFERIVQLREAGRAGARRPLVQVVVNESTLVLPAELDGACVTRIDVPRTRSRFDLLVEVDLTAGNECLLLEYDLGVLGRPQAERFAAGCEALLVAADAHPAESLTRLLSGIGAAAAGAAGHQPGTGSEPLDSQVLALADRIAAIFAEELTLAERPALDAEFFLVGGTSMTAIAVRRRIESELGCSMSLRAFFDQPTPAALAALIASRPASPRPAGEHACTRPAAGLADIPMTHAQEDIWIHERFHPGDHRFVIPVAIDIEGDLDAGRLRAAVCDAVAGQPALRSRFLLSGRVPVQRIGPAPALPDVPAMEIDSAAERAAAERALADRPFDLATDAPVRAILLGAGSGRWTLLLAVHHIAADAQGLARFLADVARRYGAVATSGAPESCGLGDRYLRLRRAVADNRGERADGPSRQQLTEYWTEALAGTVPLRLPGHLGSGAGEQAGTVVRTRELDAADAQRVFRLAATRRSSAFMVSTALFALVTGELCRLDKLVLATLSENRSAVSEGVVGCFVNVVPLVVDLSGNPALAEVVSRVRTSTLAAYEHQGLPTNAILSCAGGGQGRRDAWLRVVSDMRDERTLDLALPGCATRLRFIAGTAVRNDAELTTVRTLSGGLRWELECAERAITGQAADRVLAAMLARLRAETDDK
jgi:hypothetical protein